MSDQLKSESDKFNLIMEDAFTQAESAGITSLGVLKGLTTALANVIATFAHPNTLDNRIICANQMRDVIVKAFIFEDEAMKGTRQ